MLLLKILTVFLFLASSGLLLNLLLILFGLLLRSEESESRILRVDISSFDLAPLTEKQKASLRI